MPEAAEPPPPAPAPRSGMTPMRALTQFIIWLAFVTAARTTSNLESH